MKPEVKKERGSVVVEASFALPIFMIAMFFFINLINIFILHNKVQFAINMASHEVAVYSYLSQKSDLGIAEWNINTDGENYLENIDGNFGSIVDRFNNMKEALTGEGFMATGGLSSLFKNKVGEAIYKEVTKKYLDDAYLRAYGVSAGYEGISFDHSTYLNGDKMKMVDIIVSYNVNLTPFRLVITDNGLLKLKITQRVTIPAWMNGDGREKKEWKAVN